MKHATTTALLLLTCFGAIHCINWANITATELSTLSPNIFLNISSVELSSIPPQACQGFNASQVNYLNNDAASGLRAECLANFVNPDAATGACAGFQADFIARMAPQAFEGWTEACIRHLSPLAFSEVKSEQWPFMNSSACRGFLFETVLLFNKTSGAGMTAACLSQFSDSDGRSGCAGLFGPFVGSLDLAAFSALSAKCIYVATAEIFANISPAQFAALPAASCNGIVSYQAMRFPLTLAHVLTSECLAQFSTTNDSLAGCSGLRLDFVEQIPPATFAGLTKECINVAKSDFFLGVNATQISYIPATTFQGITQVEATAILAWANTSVAQLSNLSADGFSGVVPTALQTVVNVHKLDLVNVLTVQQTASYPQQFATEFKGLTPHAVAYLTEWSTVAQDLSTATWLKIALLKQADQQRAVQGPVFNAETLTHLPFSAYEGLRADHVPLIAAADFTLLNASHTSYFTKDMIGSLSIDQLREISPQAFSAISWVAISGLNPSLVAEITSEQIASLTQTQIGSFNCSQLQAFTTFQLVSFNQEQQQIFEEDYRTVCGFAAPPFTITGPVQPPTIGSDPSWKPEEILFVVAAVLVALLLIGGLIIFLVRRKRRMDPTRQRLIA